MRGQKFSRLVAAAVAVLFTLSACGAGGTEPTPISPQTTTSSSAPTSSSSTAPLADVVAEVNTRGVPAADCSDTFGQQNVNGKRFVGLGDCVLPVAVELRHSVDQRFVLIPREQGVLCELPNSSGNADSQVGCWPQPAEIGKDGQLTGRPADRFKLTCKIQWDGNEWAGIEIVPVYTPQGWTVPMTMGWVQTQFIKVVQGKDSSLPTCGK